MNNHSKLTSKVLYRARRGLALAALCIFASTAAATWLSSGNVEASPAEKPAVVKQVKVNAAPVRVAEAAETDNLMKNGKVLSGKLNINTATEEQLQMLPGIGPKKAQRIIEFRTQRGKFKRVRDLRRVKGFGYKTVTKLESYLTVEGKTTLEAN